MFDGLIVVGENGQLEINFDSLEVITSSEFVEELKFLVDGKEKECIDIDRNTFDGYGLLVRVALSDRIIKGMFRYNSKEFYFDCITFHDLEVLGLKVVGEYHV